MRYGTRITLALAFVGLVAMTAVAFGQQSTPSADRKLDRPNIEKLQKQRADRFGKMRGPAFKRRMVTGEFKVQTNDGFATVRMDRGTVTAVGDDSLTFMRADGELVTVTLAGDTKIRKNGESAKLSDIKAGDLVHALRVNKGEGSVLRHIRARSPGTAAEKPANTGFSI